MEYKIVTGSNISDLTNLVNTEIAKKWLPQGGVLINGMVYAQAMVKNNE